jgi:hypothetical protein
MPGISGLELKGYAFSKVGANSWGVAASVTKGAYFLNDGSVKFSPQFVEDRSFGQTELGPAEYGDLNPTQATLQGQARYEDHNHVLRALAMGSPAAVAISTSAAGQVTSWSHVIDIAPAIEGLAATFAFDKKLFVEEITTAKVCGFGETVGDGGIINETFQILGVAPTDISSININSTIYGASFPALNGKIFRNQGVLRINTQSGGSLGSGDTITVLGVIEFTFNRPHDSVHVFGTRDIIEPGTTDFPAISARFRFGRANTLSVNSFRRALSAGTAWKADITYSSATFINSTDRYKRLYQFPYLELQDQETFAQGPGQIVPVSMFMLKKPAAAPTGMSGVTHAFRLTETKVNSVNAFA